MKKFMYIYNVNGEMYLINTDKIVYIFRDACTIKMQDGTLFVVKKSEMDEILTDLEVGFAFVRR